MSVLASGAVVLIYNPVALATVYGEQAAQRAAGARRWRKPHAPLRPRHADAHRPAGAAGAGGGRLHHGAPRHAAPAAARGLPGGLAADGLQALERLQEERPTVVLSDIEMPRMDGFDLVRNIRADARLKMLPIICEKHRELPMGVMITSRIAEKHREHAMELGVNHYLGKPGTRTPAEELLGLRTRRRKARRHACHVPSESRHIRA
jgi:chemosensory pili system protein ChpA (sensor histidine kinase/response regulator)